MLNLSDFVTDAPWSDPVAPAQADFDSLIAGVIVEPLVFRKDGRGHLVELLTQRDRKHREIVHVYQVYAEPGSVRAWVYHQRQDDRLCFSQGRFRLVLWDIRPDSPTHGQLNVLDIGAANPCRVTIPAFVVHGLKNTGPELASFVNCPTNWYDPANPDKSRLPVSHPGVPYSFD
jgi:dTDP-4-dehydrorhamnose 3,5-epimerase